MGKRWATVRRWWARIGATLFVVFLLWELLAFRTWGVPASVLASSGSVTVREPSSGVFFQPRQPRGAGLIFFPGALVDPLAYTPLLRRIADAGYPTFLVKLPLRGFSTEAAAQEGSATARRILAEFPNLRWMVGGHSKGALFASRFAATTPVAALLLVGSAHPREQNLSTLQIPVIRVTGSRDGLAGPDRVRESARNLPPSTKWILIEGANHSQFGYYGFQFGDRWATISREEQQQRLFTIVQDELASLAALPRKIALSRKPRLRPELLGLPQMPALVGGDHQEAGPDPETELAGERTQAR